MTFYCSFDPKSDGTYSLLLQRGDSPDVLKHFELNGINLQLLKSMVKGIDQVLLKKSKSFKHSENSENLKLSLTKVMKSRFNLKMIINDQTYQDELSLEELKFLFMAAPFVNYLL